MNMINKEELQSWSKEKLVDVLLVYVQKENQRLQKQSAYHKRYNEQKKAEQAEFKAWKAQQGVQK